MAKLLLCNRRFEVHSAAPVRLWQAWLCHAWRSRALLGRAPLCAVALAVSAASARAQGIPDPCDDDDPTTQCMDEPPTASITPAHDTVPSANLSVTLHFSDAEMATTAWWASLNGTIVNGDFSYTQHLPMASTLAGTITLDPGTNTLVAGICDRYSQCTTKSATYVYDNANPTVAVSPGGGKYSAPISLVTIVWGDNVALKPSSRTITLNGTSVKSKFNYIGSATSASSSGAVTLRVGENTLTARICDAAGRCKSKSASYTYDNANPTVAIAPSAGTFASASRPVTITWGDNLGLNSGSRTITLNGASVRNSFSYSGSATSASSSGSVTLSAGGNTLTARICDNVGRCTTENASYTFEQPKLAPGVSAAPHNGENIDVSRCVASCFEAAASYTTPAYVSLDLPRSATLVYRSGQASPRGFIQVDAWNPISSSPPAKLSIRLKNESGAWVTLTGGTQEVFYTYPGGGDTIRLAAQFDASTLSTGAYAYTVVVRSWWSGGAMEEKEKPVRVLVVNERSSPFGAGWSLAGLERLRFIDGGHVLLTEGDGSALLFEKLPCSDEICAFESPAGEFSTLTLIREPESCGGGFCEPPTYAPVRYERSYVDGTTVYFTLTGRDTAVADRFGNRTRYGYDTQGRLVTITDPAGKRITFGYGTDGKLAWIRDAANRTTTITINSAGNLTHVQDPTGAYALQASYTPNHRMRRRTDRRGAVWAYGYAYGGTLLSDTLPTITVEGTPVRPVVHYRSPIRAMLQGPATGKGSSSNPAAPIDPASVRAEVTNPRGYTTHFAVDRFGTPTRIEEPLGRVTRIWRNGAGQDTLMIAPSGHQVRKEWSGAKLIEVEDLTTGRVVHLTYAAFGEVEHVSGDVVPVWNYWSAGKLDSTRTGTLSSPVTTYTYDSRGRPLTRTDPEGHIARNFYAPSGFMNTDSVKDSNRRTRYTYDGYGRVRTVTNPRDKTTTTLYDMLNRITKAIGPDADTTVYGYDALYLTQVRDAIGQTYRFFPNALGWNDSIADPGERTQHFSYDRNGNVVARVNREDQTTTTAYDALDRPTQITLSDGRAINYAYAPDDRWVAGWTETEAGTDTLSNDTLRYDVAGRLEYQITVRNGTRYVLKSSYDDRGQRTKLEMTTPWARSIRYHYDAFGALDSLINVAGQATAIGYNADRQANVIELPSVTITKELPSAHRTASITYSNAALNDAFGVLYGLDENKQVVQRTNQDEDSVRTFEYDDLGRLRGYEDSRPTTTTPSCHFDFDDGFVCDDASSTPLGGESYSYDKVGNRTDHSAGYQTGNRLVSFDGSTYTYDADGNMIRRYKAGVRDQRMYWNSLGQLDSAQIIGAEMNRYTYDAFGRRVSKNGLFDEQYLWDGDDIFMQLSSSGNLVAEFTYYPGTSRPHSVRRGGNVYYFATDVPGNVLGLFHGTTISNEYRYGPWGATEKFDSNVSNYIRYSGAWYDDETDFYYMRSRLYHPYSGRFISQDPIGLAGGINPYVYAGNNPVTYRDPSGLSTECPDGTVEVELADGTTECQEPIALDGIEVDGGGGGAPPSSPVWPFLPSGHGGGATPPGGGGYVGGGVGGRGATAASQKAMAACSAPAAPAGANLNGSIRGLRRLSSMGGHWQLMAQGYWIYMVWNGHPWDWKRRGGTQEYGNFFYGATGRAAGFYTSELLIGAAIAQRMFGKKGTGPLGDNPDDPPMIKAGTRYYDQGCWK